MGSTSSKLVESLHSILSGGMSNKNSYIRWCKGFKGEKEFKNKIKAMGVESLEGGWFNYSRTDSQIWSTVFWTVSAESELLYTKLYKKICKLPEVCSLYFFKYIGINEKLIKNPLYDPMKNNGLMEIIEPSFEIKKYLPIKKQWINSSIEDFKSGLQTKRITRCNLKSNDELVYLKSWAENELEILYANRYVLSVILADVKGYCTDLDHVILADEKMIVVEQKAKDPANKFKVKGDIFGETHPEEKWGFGWDGRRILWYTRLEKFTGLSVLYVIKELDNQIDRNEVGWKCCSLVDFASSVNWGSGSAETVLAPYQMFKEFD